MSVQLPSGYKVGKNRPYYVSTPIPEVVQNSKLTSVDNFWLFLLSAASILIRLYKLPNPSEVVFDEVNFGGFIHDYYHGQFFIDVHPPLAKLVYYWVAVFFGYDGQFEFESIGEKFTDNVPYIALRTVSAALGAATVPMTYLVLRNNNCKVFSSVFGCVLVVLENSLITQSRFMFLDSPLIFSMVLTYLAYSKFRNTHSFSWSWYGYLGLTGVGLGLSISMKSSGFFTYIWLGALTVIHLWNILGDNEVSDLQWWKHLVVRGFFLILVPFTIYASVFAVHFNSLPYTGPGAGPMSPSFKSTLKDFDRIRNQPVDVVYGSSVTIKHKQVGSYLHSHEFNYKGGSGEQQVTLYPFHTDFNNEWEIHPKNKRTESQLKEQVKPIKDGDIVRLFHRHTGKFLHVNDVRPPISEKDYANEVSCAGDKDLLGDVNYEFKVRILDKFSYSPNNLPMIKLRATESIFQLFHQGTRCNVISHQGKLPKWAFAQNEVACINEPTIPNTLWYIEYNQHPMLDNDPKYPRVDFGTYSFWNKLVEYHKVMWSFNKGMTDDHEYQSGPETWPFLLRGVNYYSTDARLRSAHEQPSHIYYLGNPAIYLFAILSIIFITVKQGCHVINHLNPFSIPHERVDVISFYHVTMESVLGWYIHYHPYFFFDRQLFLHHYLPALYFSILTVAYFVEYQVSRRRVVGYFLGGFVVVLSGYCYYYFMPIIYGLGWSRGECESGRWMGGWDIDCGIY